MNDENYVGSLLLYIWRYDDKLNTPFAEVS